MASYNKIALVHTDIIDRETLVASFNDDTKVIDYNVTMNINDDILTHVDAINGNIERFGLVFRGLSDTITMFGDDEGQDDDMNQLLEDENGELIPPPYKPYSNKLINELLKPLVTKCTNTKVIIDLITCNIGSIQHS